MINIILATPLYLSTSLKYVVRKSIFILTILYKYYTKIKKQFLSFLKNLAQIDLIKLISLKLSSSLSALFSKNKEMKTYICLRVCHG